MLWGIIEDREPPRFEKMIDGYSGFLFVDKDCNPLPGWILPGAGHGAWNQ